MKVTQLVSDDDAVSPVIGVILMVAITVILAAVIGTFVLGIGQDQQTTPSATFDFEYNGSGNVTVTHTGGDTFNSENTGSLEIVDDGGTASDTTWYDGSSGTTVSSGDSQVHGGGNLAQGDTVRVIWTANGGGKTNTVGSFDIP